MLASENEPREELTFGQQMNESAEPEQPSVAQVYAVPKKRQRKTGSRSGIGAKIVALALCCSLLGGAVGAGGVALATSRKSDAAPETGELEHVAEVLEGERPHEVMSVSKIDTSKQKTAAQVYADNVNSTVGITTSINTTNFWGYQTQAAAAGSGFIISDDGYIITNHHVIEGASSIEVAMFDGTKYDAELVGYDESNDVAVLKIDAKNLTPVVLGDSDELLVGDSVVAIGNPLGELTFSLTAGTVSALDRKITMSNGLSMDLIQTDCAINSGNSGGALFNLYGEVIGITNAKYSGAGGNTASIDNIGFAIPINTVRDIVKSIIEKGYISKPYIGVSVGDVGEEALTYGLPKGAAVRSVVEDGPAAKAGIQENDIITGVNGTEITCGDDLVKAIGSVGVGDELELSVYRQNETLKLKVTVEEKIQQAREDETEAADGSDPRESQQMPQQEMPQQEMPQQGNPFGGMDPFEYFFGN